MILVDTSVWIGVFRRGRPIDIEKIVAFDEIVTCLPVVQEILQGFRDERAYSLARDALEALPTVESPMSLDVFMDAAGLFRSARRAGLTIRSSTDCLIAACAIRNDLAVLHVDRDFPALASISPLREIRALP